MILTDTIVIAGDCAGSYVSACTYRRISDITQVVGFSFGAKCRFFDFNEVTPPSILYQYVHPDGDGRKVRFDLGLQLGRFSMIEYG